MIFDSTTVLGVFEIQIDPKVDERGFFARCWCQKEFADQGLESELVQCSLSYNTRKGTLRGVHYQMDPHSETKVIRCTRGAIYDVVVDLRRHSPTFRGWIARVLTQANRHMMYVPAGCGHGFLTLEDETEVLYQMSEFYHPDSARGVRWDDPTFRIEWPEAVQVISERDRTYPDF